MMKCIKLAQIVSMCFLVGCQTAPPSLTDRYESLKDPEKSCKLSRAAQFMIHDYMKLGSESTDIPASLWPAPILSLKPIRVYMDSPSCATAVVLSESQTQQSGVYIDSGLSSLVGRVSGDKVEFCMLYNPQEDDSETGLGCVSKYTLTKLTQPETATARSIHPTVHARHILVLAPEGSDGSAKRQSLAEAEGIRESLIAGADFETMAKQYSACPSKESGGDLGSFRRGQMVKPFEEAAFSQKVGEIGPVVYTQFGYHIIQVLDRENE